MKYLDEFRDPELARRLLDRIHAAAKRDWVLMEVCGGQTHAIVRYGIDELLPPSIELVHGPGCPVCVTPLSAVDRAHAIASRPEVIFTSFGDMLRVPGSEADLLALKARGGDVRVVYSPLDALRLAQENPDRKVVFFGIGFETTAPANAMALREAKRLGVSNFSMLVSHVLVPPAIRAILDGKENRVQAFLGPGHVCSVTGYRDYEKLTADYRVPIVISGFEPVDLLAGILATIEQLEAGRAVVENGYKRSVVADGNTVIRSLVDEVFEVSDREWRGIGTIPSSGLALRAEYAAHDAEKVFAVGNIQTKESSQCISGRVLQGLKKPCDCPAFGKTCTPDTPLGATMVSSEGACAAYFAHGRHLRLADASAHA
jgi:hydrogenase expression/formation protein HypD